MYFLHEFRTILRRMRFTARLLVFLCAVVYGWASFSSGISSAHDPITWSGHDDALLLAAQSHGHDHSHDAPEVDDGDTGQAHGYHAADHSHDKADLKRSETPVVARLQNSWGVTLHALAYPAPCFPFERPPKKLSMS